MGTQTPKLSRFLDHPPHGLAHKLESDEDYERHLKKLQLKMLRVQQGAWHLKRRIIIALEGFDASGKGGAIRRLVEGLDPRGVAVHPIGPPLGLDQQRHWLYRFWARLPEPGVISIFDRTWYGRVLVERVEGLASPRDWKRGYREINEFEAMLVADKIDVIKIFLAIDKKEQLRRFEQRLADPYKRWKLTPDDIKARHHWDKYVKAVDDLFRKTHVPEAPWHLVSANDKPSARLEVLRIATTQLKHYGDWMEKEVEGWGRPRLKRMLKKL